MIKFTEESINQIVAFINSEKDITETVGLRISVLPGGCAGFKYDICIVDGPESDDEIYNISDKFKLYVDPFSLQYIENLEVDYKTNITSSGFSFNNPAAIESCGCHTSFNVK